MQSNFSDVEQFDFGHTYLLPETSLLGRRLQHIPNTSAVPPRSKLGGASRRAALIVLCSVSCACLAQQPTPAGDWRTFDERTGQADGVVRIVEEKGEFSGQVTAVFSPPAESPNPLCESCRGELKNQPVIGMTILRGLRWNGEDYSEGTILDPDDGKVYRCRMRVVDGGRKLEVRGYAGIALFGRTQIWERAQ